MNANFKPVAIRAIAVASILLLASGCGSDSESGSGMGGGESDKFFNAADGGATDTLSGVNPVPTPGENSSSSGASDGSSSLDFDTAGVDAGGGSSSSSGADAGGSGGSSDTYQGGNTGLSQAGAQDFGLFRQLLEAGQVPTPGSLDDLGFFHEHKLDYPDPKCGQDMCMHGMLGQMGNMMTGSTCTLIQIGLNTHILPANLKRPPLHIVLAIDTSKSMTGDAIGYLKQGLKQMLDHLEKGDKLSLLRFSTGATTLLEAVDATDKLTIEKAIIGLTAGGDTNLYAGLFTAFKLASKHQKTGWDNRVVLLTDGEANVGITQKGKLVSLAKGYAKKGIGITTIGVGKSFSVGLLAAVAEVGAGNFYFLDNPAAVKEVFTEEVKTFLVPIALDVKIEVASEDTYVIGAAYGTHGWKGDSDGGTIEIPTLFLAGRKSSETALPGQGSGRRGGGGAIMIELMPLPGVKKTLKVAELKLTWTHPTTGKVHKQDTSVIFGNVQVADGGLYFSAVTVEKGFVMLNIYAGFEMAIELAADADPGAAIGVLQALRGGVAKWLKGGGLTSKGDPDPDVADDLKYIDLFIANLKKVGNQTPISKPPEPWPID